MKLLFQTLEDRGNPDQIEDQGPFVCKWPNTWLGDGYYFWDTFIENSHWWGTMRYGSEYVICQAVCDFDSSICYDLVGDTEHMLDFHNVLDTMKAEGKLMPDVTVARVLEFSKKTGSFKFEAIRVYGIKSISEHKKEYEKYLHNIYFEVSKPQYLDFKPAIQVCILTKKGLNLRDFHIIFPENYSIDYMV